MTVRFAAKLKRVPSGLSSTSIFSTRLRSTFGNYGQINIANIYRRVVISDKILNPIWLRKLSISSKSDQEITEQPRNQPHSNNDNRGEVLVEVDKRNLVRAMSGSVVLQLIYWYSVGAFDDMFQRLGLIGQTLSDPLFGVLDPYIGGIGATLTVANLFLARIFTKKMIGKVVLHPSGKLCSLYMYTTPFGTLEERVVNIRDIVDYNITDNYYTLKVDADRTFIMIDRSKASYGDENYENERLLRHIISGNPIINANYSVNNQHIKKTKIGINRNVKQVTDANEKNDKDENLVVIKPGAKRKRKKRRR